METYPKLMMQQVQSLSLILTREANELTQAQCDVMLNGESMGILVPGHILEAAVQVNDQRYILFLTDDVIFEESLTIALIDVHDGLKEIVRLGNEYSTGSFADLQITDDSVNFRFIGIISGQWKYQIHLACASLLFPTRKVLNGSQA